ncbi:MAG: hypothetical protein Fur0010_08810 [Bdellovibrio sp.]
MGYGYTSCLTCHYNPFGNGPLTDYGRALGATTVSDRMMWSKETTEDEIGQKSGFMYSKPALEWLRPALNYRGLKLYKNYGKKTETSEYITMQASASLVLRLGPTDNRDKFIAVVEGGYAPTPRSDKNNTEDNYRSREHYLGYRINERWGVYAGLMDKAFGIRVPDHIAFSRISTQNTMNDQVHGLLLHYTRPEFEIGVHPFVGNLSQDSDLRVKGAAATGEYTWGPKTRLGLSFISSKSTFLSQNNLALHGRWGFGKGNSLLAETGISSKTIERNQQNTKSQYLFLQGHVEARRGLFALVTSEYFKANTALKNEIMRMGPGIQWFPMNGFEFRADIYNTRVFSPDSVSDDTWDLTGQVHLWF